MYSTYFSKIHVPFFSADILRLFQNFRLEVFMETWSFVANYKSVWALQLMFDQNVQVVLLTPGWLQPNSEENN